MIVIAILAAIVAQNFLEALARAKVSRAHADMRTEAVTIKAYQVDWNTAPIGRESWQHLHTPPALPAGRPEIHPRKRSDKGDRAFQPTLDWGRLIFWRITQPHQAGR